MPVSSTNSSRFSHHVRDLFLVLIVLVSLTSLSSVFLLDRVLSEEDANAAGQLSRVIEAARQHWLRQPRDASLPPAEFAGLLSHNPSGRFALSVLRTDSTGARSWHHLSIGGGHPWSPHWDSLGDTSPLSPPSDWRVGGEYWRSVTHAERWGNDAVVATAAMPAPLLGTLRFLMVRELWVRGVVLLSFAVFAVMFHRYVLRPFRDMRRRAASLVDSGVLSEEQGIPSEDPEYVMATFDVLVRRLMRQTQDLQARAATSERRARDLERFNEYMLTSLSTGVVIVGADGSVLRLNRSAEKSLRLDAIDVIGRSFAEAGLYPELVAVIEEGLRDGYVYSRREVRVDLAHASGPCYLGINTSRILDENAVVVGLSVLLTDLTEVKRLYDELAENQRLADLGEMAAGLAHQLRNSIAAIMGYGKLLEERPDSPRPEWIGAIISETNETAAMITKFLDFARPLNADRCPVDLRDVVRDAVASLDSMGRSGGVTMTVHPHPDMDNCRVSGDSVLLKQVFVNLIQNAIEAMPDGGAVDIRFETCHDIRPRRPFYKVTVTDTGGGVPERNRTRIFHPFYTSKETGTGLGLPLAKKIAIVHGGNLMLESSGRSGSTFAVTLPAEPALDQSAAAALEGHAVAAIPLHGD